MNKLKYRLILQKEEESDKTITEYYSYVRDLMICKDAFTLETELPEDKVEKEMLCKLLDEVNKDVNDKENLFEFKTLKTKE